MQQQLSQQMQALSIYQSSNNANSNQVEPPPPYPIVSTSSAGPVQPPSYSASMQNRQSPTQSQQDYRKSPSSGIYSGPTSAGSPSPITVSTISPNSQSQSMARPTPLQAWGVRQAKTQPPIIMQSVKSTQVQKPVLQTAIAPTSPQPISNTPSSTPPPPPSYASSIQQKQQQQQQQQSQPPPPAYPPVVGNSNGPSSAGAVNIGISVGVPTTEPPSYATTMQALAAQRGIHHPLPPPPYGTPTSDESCGMTIVINYLLLSFFFFCLCKLN